MYFDENVLYRTFYVNPQISGPRRRSVIGLASCFSELRPHRHLRRLQSHRSACTTGCSEETPMRRRTRSRTRVLGDGTPLRNRLLAALPDRDYRRIRARLQMQSVAIDETLQEPSARITTVYFPNGGVFSVTTEMRDGVEAASCACYAAARAHLVRLGL
jgi:hypothetical protein